MIYFTGDLHGGATSYHISIAAFTPAKRGDIVICAGDFGGVWWPDYHINEKHRNDEDDFLDSTLSQRVLWLAVDGNHENFARLFGGEFPLVEIFGGKAYEIRENVYYLKRGEVFTIDGVTIFAFGGAASHDKDPGWEELSASPYGGGKVWNKGRVEGVDWWPDEIPNEADFESACRNLEKVGWRVNHVVTHTCPRSQRISFQKAGTKRAEDPVELVLQRFVDKGLDFDFWHFGHFHQEKMVDKFVCHFNRVRPITEFRPASYEVV